MEIDHEWQNGTTWRKHGKCPASSRERVPTKKGLAYQTELLQRDGDSALKAFKRQLETTKDALAFSTDITLLQRERYKLEAQMDDLTNVYRKLIDVLDSEESKSKVSKPSAHSLYRRVHSNATYSKFSHYPLRLTNERRQSTETDWRRERHYETGWCTHSTTRQGLTTLPGNWSVQRGSSPLPNVDQILWDLYWTKNKGPLRKAVISLQVYSRRSQRSSQRTSTVRFWRGVHRSQENTCESIWRSLSGVKCLSKEN